MLICMETRNTAESRLHSMKKQNTYIRGNMGGSVSAPIAPKTAKARFDRSNGKDGTHGQTPVRVSQLQDMTKKEGIRGLESSVSNRTWYQLVHASTQIIGYSRPRCPYGTQNLTIAHLKKPS